MHQHRDPYGKYEITPKTRVPIYVLGSAIGLAVYLTFWFASLSSKLDNAVTQDQVQQWIDDARERNPTVNWPRLPDKRNGMKQMNLTKIIP